MSLRVERKYSLDIYLGKKEYDSKSILKIEVVTQNTFMNHNVKVIICKRGN